MQENPEIDRANEAGQVDARESASSQGEERRSSPTVSRRRFASMAIAGTLTLAAIGGGVVGSAATLYLTQGNSAGAAASSVGEVPGRHNVVNLSAESAITSIYNQVSPSTVTITVGQDTTSRSSQLPGIPDMEGEGSGFIVDKSGYILTNAHVVENAQRITVKLHDGTELTGTVVGQDPTSDLALIKAEIPASKLAVATLGDSDSVQPGDVAIAIGSPFGLDNSVTAGIVSAVGRDWGTAAGRPMRGLIQTDTPINPGNSGGPLLDANGDVIGITTAIESPVRGSVGVGFAIPINQAKKLLPQLTQGEQIAHPWLGISGTQVTSQLAKDAGLAGDSGVLVIDVTSGSPADKAGLRGNDSSVTTRATGDIIVAIDGHTISKVQDISSYLDTKKVGDQVTLTVLRDGEKLDLEATLAAWPALQSG